MQKRLEQIFIERKQRNTQYSLSAFARDLGCSPSFLSRVLRGERRLTPQQIIKFKDVLGLSPDELEPLLKGAVLPSLGKKPNDLRVHLTLDQFRMMSEWIHLAILNLTYVKDFQSNAEWISDRLGTHPTETRSAIDRLFQLGFLKNENGRWIKTKAQFELKPKKSEEAVRQFHLSHLKRAEQTMKNDKAFENRLIIGSTFAVEKKKIPDIKRKLSRAIDSILKDVKKHQHNDLYHVGIQLIPLLSQEKK